MRHSASRRAVFLGTVALPIALWMLAAANVQAAAWSDLWRRPDQRGQRLLESGQPERAARLFRDPRRRAYADLRAGRYADAAKALAPLKDPDSEYNLGNALAHAGRLEAALAAYDAALKQAPDDRDARHNRDLVARALERQNKAKKDDSRKSQSDSGGKQPSGGRQQSGDKQQSGDNQQSGDKQASGNRPSGGAPQTGPPRQGPGQAQNGQARSRQTPQAQAGRSAGPASLARAGSGKAATGGSRNGAGRDAPSKQANEGAQPQPEVKPKPKPEAGPRPETEQSLALEQWLRRIPDDPGGLLRRKFLIEHALEQQGVEL